MTTNNQYDMSNMAHPEIVVVVPLSEDRFLQFQKLVDSLPEIVSRVVAAVFVDSPFNRGLAKNVGFLESETGPTDTVVFHDVDIVPVSPLADYSPCMCPRTLRHLYGHIHCLGGVVVMQNQTFVQIDGFPNDQQAWGGEDRQLQLSALKHGVDIDRYHFSKRFTGDIFRELDRTGQIMTHARACREFMTKPKIVPNHVAPCNLGATVYVLTKPSTEIWINRKCVKLVYFKNL